MKKIVATIFLIFITIFLLGCDNKYDEKIFEERNYITIPQYIFDEIYKLNPTSEWIECIWNINQRDVACAIVDQLNLDGLSKIIIFQLNDNWEISKQKEFLQEPWKSVNFVCGDSCYPSDFRFEWDNVLKYKWHELISPDKIFSIEY